MPLVMDDEQYMEDLFNDHSEPIQIAAPQAPIKGFAQRLDELQERGCCQKIAWSKTGCLASVSPDGRSVSLRNYVRNPADGKWVVGDDNPLTPPLPNEDARIAHLSWGHLGTDLAVVDTAGRVLIYSNRHAIGRMSISRSTVADQEDELGALVGLHWLAVYPHQQKSHIVWSASRIRDDWAYRTTSHVFQDPHNILESKAALICVTKTGVLRLLYQQTDNSWHEVSTELNAIGSTKDMFTHAAFTSNNDDTLLLAAYDVSDQLHLYRVRINWSAPPQHQKWTNPQQAPAGPMSPPSLDATCLLVEDSFIPVGPGHEDINSTSTTPKTALPVQLTHLHFLHVVPEQQGMGTSPTIFATFTHSPTVIAPIDHAQPHQNSFSIISRWDCDPQPESRLHSSLEQLSFNKKPRAPDGQTVQLRKHADIYTNAVVLSLTPAMYNNVLVLYQSDGSTDFRNTVTMESIHPDYSTDKVSSLPQAGFTFPLDEPALHLSLSGNCCLAASLGSDGAIKVRNMTYIHGSLGSTEDDPKHEAALAALALQHASSCNQYYSGDDIFAMIPDDMSPSRVHQLMKLLFHSMGINIDCVNQNPQESICAGLGKNPSLVRCLSAQNTLGYLSYSHRKLSSTLAWATLNLRHVSIITLLVYSYHRGRPQQGQAPQLSLLRPEMATSLIGLSSWMVDFLIMVVDDLFRLADSLRGQEITQEAVQQQLLQANSPSLFCLICSLPRVLLRDWQKALAWMQRSADNVVSSEKVTLDVRNSYTGLLAAFSDRPSIWRVFEQLINETENSVRHCYSRSGIKDNDRARVERDMFIKAEVPDALMPVVKHLLTKVFLDDNGLMEKVNRADIMFRDFSWLGIPAYSADKPSRRVEAFEKTSAVDVLRKTTFKWPKKGTKKVKRCTRGCAYCEDLLPENITNKEKAQMGPWYWGVSKSCVCGNNWTVVESPGEK